MKIPYLTKTSPIIKRLFLKKKLLEAGDPAHKKIRPLLLIPSGGLRGVNAGGSALALSVLGFGNVFDVVVGVSTGAAVAAYFLSGGRKPYIGASVYYEECTTPMFSNLACLHPYVDIDYIEKIMKQGEKRIEPKNIASSRSQFYVGVMRVPDGKGYLLNAKKARPSLLRAVKASMAMYGLYNKPVKVNGKRFLDGEPVFPLPVREMIRRFDPTDIVILSSIPLRSETQINKTGEEIVATVFLSKYPRVVKAVQNHHKRYRNELEYLTKKNDVRIGVIPPADSMLTMLTQDKAELKKAVRESAKKTLHLFGRSAIRVNLL